MSENNEQKIQPITSIDQITKIVKKKDVAYASHYLVPSLKKEVPFNEINTSQQKRLVKSVIDSPIYNTEFIYTFREILKENCQDSTVDIDQLTILDKLILAMGLRIKSIGSNVDIEIETKEGRKVNVSLDIPKILSLAYETIKEVPPQTFEDQYFIIECNLPTIGTEYKIEKELRTKVTNIDIENVQELRKTVGDAFVAELVKYISKVSVKGDGEELVPVDWERFTYSERIRIMETFKTGLLKEILNYVSKIRDELNKIELVKFEFNGETYERRLSIDSSFFTIS